MTATATTRTAAANLTARQALTFRARKDQSYEFVKYVGVDTELSSGNPEKSAVAASQQAADQGWSALSSAHVAAWDALWRSDIVLPDRPDLQQWVRAGLYGLLSNIRQGADDSISPVGLTSDNYAGLIFWDAETWMYPALLLTHPEVAKSIVEYRYRTMPGARATRSGWATRACSTRGTAPAAVIWRRSATAWTRRTASPRSTSRATSPSRSGSTTWPPATRPGCAGTAGRCSAASPSSGPAACTANADGSYSINNVAGPDEYSNGVDDGVYTNAVAATALRAATSAAAVLGRPAPATWTTIADHLRMPFDQNQQVFLQYDGYTGSQIKQADTVLLIYPVEWPMTSQVASNTLDYYAAADRPGRPGDDRLRARHRRRRRSASRGARRTPT